MYEVFCLILWEIISLLVRALHSFPFSFQIYCVCVCVCVYARAPLLLLFNVFQESCKECYKINNALYLYSGMIRANILFVFVSLFPQFAFLRDPKLNLKALFYKPMLLFQNFFGTNRRYFVCILVSYANLIFKQASCLRFMILYIYDDFGIQFYIS